MNNEAENLRLQPLIHLLGLRYRLLWAQARLRNGKIALFVIGYLLLCPAVMILAFGGMSTASAAIRIGKAEIVAGIVFSVCFSSITLAAIAFGAGMNSAFSDIVLRRYPISAAERFASRHISACLEPLWILGFALYLGLAIGFLIFNNTSLLLAIPVAFFLVLGNYLFARILQILVERLMTTRAAPFLFVLAIMLLSTMPMLAGGIFSQYIDHATKTSVLLHLTPPFAAAAVMTQITWLPVLGWTICLLAWCLVFVTVLYGLDRLPISTRTAAETQAGWNSIYDRAASCLGAEMAPLVGKILRYYLRSPQMRYSYPFVALAMLLAIVDAQRSFVTAIGMISIVGSMCMGAMTLNIFGFDGAGFRRYFLLPVHPAKILYATALVPLILGAATIPISLGLWLAIAPVVHTRMIIMVVSSGFGGLFLFQGLGIWTSLLSPRAIPFKAVLGNKLSFSANALMMGSLILCFGLPTILDRMGNETILEYWWLAILILLATAIFYVVTLRAGAVIFSKRREIMLSTIERGC
jgi:hypothetical protein